MAIATNNSPFRGLNGKTGNIVCRQLRGKTVISASPSPARYTSDAQKAARVKFRNAQEYAKKQMAFAHMKEMYATRIDTKKHSAHAVASVDYLNAPIIKSIKTSAYTGEVAQQIIIRASDDFEVTSVRVTVYDGHGNIVERGIAKPIESLLYGYLYLTKVINTHKNGSIVKVEASDHAGNNTTRSVDCERLTDGKCQSTSDMNDKMKTQQLVPCKMEWTRVQLYRGNLLG